MLNSRKILTFLLVMTGVFMFVGCSEETPLNPSTETTDIQEIEASSFDLHGILASYGISVEEADNTAEKRPVYPAPLTVISSGTRACGEIKNNTYWAPVTNFIEEDNGAIRWTAGWLQDDPESQDPNMYLCTIISEQPLSQTYNWSVIDPSCGPVNASTSMVLDHLSAPSGGIQLPVFTDPVFLFDYHFGYPDPDVPGAYREYRLSRFRVQLN
jgi:hypothetical protein